MNSNLHSQKKLSGVYSLRGIHDMAAAFEFNQEGSFRFYYAYGAVDRNAEGTYTVEGTKIALKSTKEAGKDFTIKSQTQKSKNYRIQVIAPNPYLLQHVRAACFIGKEQTDYFSDKSGLIEINNPAIDSIFLQHTLYPDIFTKIKDADNKNTIFEVELNPSLVQVSFKGIDLDTSGEKTKARVKETKEEVKEEAKPEEPTMALKFESLRVLPNLEAILDDELQVIGS